MPNHVCDKRADMEVADEIQTVRQNWWTDIACIHCILYISYLMFDGSCWLEECLVKIKRQWYCFVWLSLPSQMQYELCVVCVCVCGYSKYLLFLCWYGMRHETQVHCNMMMDVWMKEVEAEVSVRTANVSVYACKIYLWESTFGYWGESRVSKV